MNQPHTDLSLDGRAREPSPSAGTDSAGEPPGVSRILRQDQQERLPLLAGKRVVYRERWQSAIDHVCFFTIFISFVCWVFTAPLSFLHIVCILCIIAFGASSFYSFLYQKCTTLYHILNNYDDVCFLFSFVFLFSRRESVVSCGRIEKPHCFSCICFYRMLKPHVASSFTWAYIEIAFILVVQPLIGLTVLKKLNICTKHIRASSADMLLSHFGLVRDIICTVLSVCCMFTAYYIRIS